MKGRTLITLLLLLGLVGCGDGSAGSDSTNSSATDPSTTDVSPTIPQPLLDREWIASAWITVAGPQPISDGKSSLRFDADGRVYVTTPCNTGSGRTAIEGGTITFDQVVTTRKACIDEELANAETQFLELLSHPLTWSINDGELTLTPQDVSDSGLILRG